MYIRRGPTHIAKMYLALLTMTLANAAIGGAIAPEQEFSTKRVRQLELVDTSTSPENSQAMYAAPSHSALPAHFYPTYPEHAAKHALQTGYDGFLIPVSPARPSWTSSIFTALVPLSTYALSYGARAGVYIWNLFVLLVIGGVLTTTVCTFTPFCTITFLGLGINKNQVREQVSELARAYITPESMNAATLLVKRAIEKYAELQRQQQEEEEQKKLNSKSEKRRRRR